LLAPQRRIESDKRRTSGAQALELLGQTKQFRLSVHPLRHRAVSRTPSASRKHCIRRLSAATHLPVYREDLMARSAEATRRRIIDAAYELFYRRGYARVGIDEVAERASITKRTFYYHFTSKDELLAKALEQHHDMAVARIRLWSDHLPADPAGMIQSLFDNLAQWAQRPRWAGAGFTRIVMELADLPGHPARAIARRHKKEVETWLVGELAARGVEQATVKARQIMLLIEGCFSLLLMHGDKSYADAASSAARRLVMHAEGDDQERRCA
jgi:AcrR family transcriptional regulator